MLIQNVIDRFKTAVGGRERILFLVMLAGIFAGFIHGVSDLTKQGWGQAFVGLLTSLLNSVLLYLYIYNKIKRKTITRILIITLLPIILMGLVVTSSTLESVIFMALYPMLALMLLKLYEALFWITVQVVGFFTLIIFDIAIAKFDYIQILQLMSVQIIVSIILGTYVVSTRKLQKELSKERDKLKEMNLNLEVLVHERTVELEKVNSELKHKASTDHLTKVANRTMLFEILTERLENYHRYGHLYSIIMLDIDFFKKINDGYGHSMGDKVLIDVAQLTQKLLRKNDLLARYGGEEFVIVLPNTNEEEARLVAEKIRSTLESAELIEDHKVTASFGICQIRDNETTKSLIECADAALYSSKESGRNRVTLG